jgi:hypothetical protein
VSGDATALVTPSRASPHDVVTPTSYPLPRRAVASPFAHYFRPTPVGPGAYRRFPGASPFRRLSATRACACAPALRARRAPRARVRARGAAPVRCAASRGDRQCRVGTDGRLASARQCCLLPHALSTLCLSMQRAISAPAALAVRCAHPYPSSSMPTSRLGSANSVGGAKRGGDGGGKGGGRCCSFKRAQRATFGSLTGSLHPPVLCSDNSHAACVLPPGFAQPRSRRREHLLRLCMHNRQQLPLPQCRLHGSRMLLTVRGVTKSMDRN